MIDLKSHIPLKIDCENSSEKDRRQLRDILFSQGFEWWSSELREFIHLKNYVIVYENGIIVDSNNTKRYTTCSFNRFTIKDIIRRSKNINIQKLIKKYKGVK